MSDHEIRGAAAAAGGGGGRSGGGRGGGRSGGSAPAQAQATTAPADVVVAAKQEVEAAKQEVEAAEEKVEAAEEKVEAAKREFRAATDAEEKEMLRDDWKTAQKGLANAREFEKSQRDRLVQLQKSSDADGYRFKAILGAPAHLIDDTAHLGAHITAKFVADSCAKPHHPPEHTRYAEVAVAEKRKVKDHKFAG